MRHALMVAAAALTALALAACQPPAKPPEPAPPPATEIVDDQPPEAPAGDITAVLTEVKDAGYPMFWVTFTPAGGTTVSALLNNEEIEPPVDDIRKLQGQTVTATIAVVSKNDMLRLSAGDQVLYEMERAADQPLQIPADAKTITGKITGLKDQSGDLPGLLTVKAKDGTVVELEHFVDGQLAGYENKEVTVVYTTFQSSEVTKIAAAK